MDHNITKTTKTTTCLFLFLISLYVFLSLVDKTTPSSSYCTSILPLLLAFLLALLIIFTVRTTIVAWITVMVLLAFAGKRRRILVKEGRKITSDVAMYLAQVVLKERSIVAFAFATIMSLIIMAWLRMAH